MTHVVSPLSTPTSFLRTVFIPTTSWRALVGLALCLSVLATAVLAVGTAAAQSDGETEIARQRFLEGVRHYDQHDYDKARLAFLQAYLLKPHPAVLLNLAQ